MQTRALVIGLAAVISGCSASAEDDRGRPGPSGSGGEAGEAGSSATGGTASGSGGSAGSETGGSSSGGSEAGGAAGSGGTSTGGSSNTGGSSSFATCAMFDFEDGTVQGFTVYGDGLTTPSGSSVPVISSSHAASGTHSIAIEVDAPTGGYLHVERPSMVLMGVGHTYKAKFYLDMTAPSWSGWVQTFFDGNVGKGWTALTGPGALDFSAFIDQADASGRLRWVFELPAGASGTLYVDDIGCE
jgi:hypothetical protein